MTAIRIPSKVFVLYRRSSFFIYDESLLVFITSIYALIAFGSGIKQVYFLRNIEVFLVVIALTFGGSILGSA